MSDMEGVSGFCNSDAESTPTVCSNDLRAPPPALANCAHVNPAPATRRTSSPPPVSCEADNLNFRDIGAGGAERTNTSPSRPELRGKLRTTPTPARDNNCLRAGGFCSAKADGGKLSLLDAARGDEVEGLRRDAVAPHTCCTSPTVALLAHSAAHSAAGTRLGRTRAVSSWGGAPRTLQFGVFGTSMGNRSVRERRG